MQDPRDPIIESLEAQARDILRLLQARTAKRPLIIEFSGSPKSGKTTAIGVLSLFFRRNNFRVETFTERASISPVKVFQVSHLNGMGGIERMSRDG